jgi:quercetin dioxygenase-like cupin family protein
VSAPSATHYLTERPPPALIRASGATITILVSAADSGGAIGVIETVFPPGDGVPFHMHSREDETFYVVSGIDPLTVRLVLMYKYEQEDKCEHRNRGKS